MKTILTAYDMKEIVKRLFESNDEDIIINNENEKQKTIKINDYLNIEFYAWKNRVVYNTMREYEQYDHWTQSLNYSLNKSYALVEQLNEEVVTSNDIDSATKNCEITFMIQEDKVEILDHYIMTLRNALLGNTQEIQNSNGDILKAYITIGNLMYEQEPIMTQLGECMIVKCGFVLTYLNNALSYSDVKMLISLDNEEHYSEIPLIKATWQSVYTSNALPFAERPDLTGVIATSLSVVKTLTFYDWDKDLSNQLNSIFWGKGAYKINDNLTTATDPNVIIFIKVKVGDNEYVYRDMIDNITKTLTNNDYIITTITLKGCAKGV